MYNGIGLQTARGSGTNGYVQRNLSFIKTFKDKINFRTEEEIKKFEADVQKGPNKDILEHAHKRALELKCAEMEDIMKEQGYPDSEVAEKVRLYRTMLMEREQNLKLLNHTAAVDNFGRSNVRETHAVAEAQQQKNARLKEAFGISEFFVEGSSLDPDRRTKEEAARQAHHQQEEDEEHKKRKHEWVSTPSPSPPPPISSERKDKKEKKKKKKRTRERSSSRESRKKRKSKKSKRSRSVSPKKKKRRSRDKKRKTKNKKKRHSSSSSSSSSDDTKCRRRSSKKSSKCTKGKDNNGSSSRFKVKKSSEKSQKRSSDVRDEKYEKNSQKVKARAVEESICEAESRSGADGEPQDAGIRNLDLGQEGHQSPAERIEKRKSNDKETEQKTAKIIKLSPPKPLQIPSPPEPPKTVSPPTVENVTDFPQNIPSPPLPPLPPSENCNKHLNPENPMDSKKSVLESPPKSPKTFFSRDKEPIKFKERGPLSRKIGVLLKSTVKRSVFQNLNIGKNSQDSESFGSSSLETRLQNSAIGKEGNIFRPFSSLPLKIGASPLCVTQNGGKNPLSERLSPPINRSPTKSPPATTSNVSLAIGEAASTRGHRRSRYSSCSSSSSQSRSRSRSSRSASLHRRSHSSGSQRSSITKSRSHSKTPSPSKSRSRSRSRSRSHSKSRSLSRSRSYSRSKSKTRSRSRSHSADHYSRSSRSRSRSSATRSRSRSASRSRSRLGSKSKSKSKSRSHSRSFTRSRTKSRTRSRSPSIPRRKGSPSFLDKRRITSARKRPVPYHRPTPPPSPSSTSSGSSWWSRSRSRSWSRTRSLSHSR